ncbi:hypothetical protein ALC57_14551 [Trachymyrmex cornetzi]|uniref:Uncharacterized protein n=1 Tax=Trachymyrmex cornetzi TaxID=471704 RepID=A0A151IY79_9HYME|nr:hypothetical protein ALC57_14551 [Trachymyrmex cornetzi]
MHSRRTPVQDGRECNARYARDGSKVRQSERLVLPAQPIPRKRNTPRFRSLSLSLFRDVASSCRNSRGCQSERHSIPKHQTERFARKQASIATSATTPSSRRYVVARSIPKSQLPCLKRFDFGLTTTELKVVKERRNSSTAAEKNAFTVGSHITTSSHSLIRPCGFFPRWMRADKNPPCQTKTESRHAGRSEMVHADGRELVNERTRAIH